MPPDTEITAATGSAVGASSKVNLDREIVALQTITLTLIVVGYFQTEPRQLGYQSCGTQTRRRSAVLSKGKQ